MKYQLYSISKEDENNILVVLLDLTHINNIRFEETACKKQYPLSIIRYLNRQHNLDTEISTHFYTKVISENEILS